jgi:hypothetical protein
VGDYNYEAAPQVVFMANRNCLYYDQKGMRFLINEMFTNTSSAFANAGNAARFNLNNIGKKLIHMERGFMQGASSDPYKYAFFIEPDGSKRYLYIMDVQNAAAPDKAMLDISTAPEISDARFYAVSNKGPAVFYTTSSTIYNFTFDYVNNTYTPPVAGYRAPAGETITAFQMFKSHMADYNQVAFDSKFLLVATWNEIAKVGKLYLLSVNETSGAITPTPQKEWTVDGKVGAMSYKAT